MEKLKLNFYGKVTESLCDETTEIDEDYYFTIHIPKYMSTFISTYMYTKQDLGFLP